MAWHAMPRLVAGLWPKAADLRRSRPVELCAGWWAFLRETLSRQASWASPSGSSGPVRSCCEAATFGKPARAAHVRPTTTTRRRIDSECATAWQSARNTSKLPFDSHGRRTSSAVAARRNSALLVGVWVVGRFALNRPPNSGTHLRASGTGVVPASDIVDGTRADWKDSCPLRIVFRPERSVQPAQAERSREPAQRRPG